jgi:hypothetical protein
MMSPSEIFKDAALEDAVSGFVRQIERPRTLRPKLFAARRLPGGLGRRTD